MVLGYHTIMTMYGFWLPNDPRGSWSDFVRSWELFRFGKATKVTTSRSLARVEHDQARRRAAKSALTYPPVVLTGRQAGAVGRGFAQAGRDAAYVIHACSILPQHVHMVLARHPRPIRRVAGHLKARGTRALKADGLWGDTRRPIWTRRSWNVYLNTPEDIRRAIRYVVNNPLKERKPLQHWSFVTPYAPV